jgi:tripartite-type tricarboxylate transporter receptor subunit TctC
MLSPHRVAWVFCVPVMVLGAGWACGQSYPYRPVRLITSGLGGSSDFVARLIAQGLTGSLGEQVIVDNRPGGVIPGEILARAQNDGYTLLFSGSTLWLLPFLRDAVPYDPVKDFSPITCAVTSTGIVGVHPSLPVKSVKELIALAKARPGELNFATAGSGGSSHLAGELFRVIAGVDIVAINYKGPAAAMTDLIAGRLQLTFGSAATTLTHVNAGRVRALAVINAQPSALFPGLPTVAAAGLPNYQFDAPLGVFAPARIPPALVKRLNQEIVSVLNRKDVKERLANTGLEVVGGSPEHFGEVIKSEMSTLGKIIKDANIRG